METSLTLSFLAGVASIISPCVLPLIPVVMGHSLVKNSYKNVLAFVLGFFVIFSIITVLTTIFTAAINAYLFYFRIGAAILLIIIGLFFIWNRPLPSPKITSYKKSGLIGSFSFGLITCLAWSPCFGPYVVAVATAGATSGDIIYSAVNMMVFSLGFSLTILLVALLSSKIDYISISKYNKWIRPISGIIIILAGLYLLWGLI